MKKTFIKLFSLTLMLGALTSCGGNSKKVATINVVNGTGGGTFNIGESATITATIPEGRSFDFWALNGSSVSTDNPYTFTVTEDATYVATFKIAKKVNIQVTNGTGSGAYDVGSSVTITANTPPESKSFDYWESNGKKVSSENPYTFTATEDATFTAIYKSKTINIQVINGSGAGTYDVGSSVTITANTPTDSKFFDYWESNGKKVSTENPYTFTASEDATFTAIYGEYRGVLRTNTTPIGIKPINVSEGGTITVDYKYVDPTTDIENGVSLYFGSDETHRYGNYKIFNDKLEKSYNGVTFTTLDDGYHRLTVVVSKLDQVYSGDTEPTTISQIMFRWFEPTKGVYFDVKSEPVHEEPRGTLFKSGGTPISLAEPYIVSEGGTLVVDYKYVDPTTDASKSILLFFGSDTLHRFGDYKILKDSLGKSYDGVTFIALDDGYYRMIINISQLNEVYPSYMAPTSISEIRFRDFLPTKGVYFDINHEERREKTTEFQMDDDEFVINNYTDIHVDDSCNFDYLTKTIEYGIQHSNPDIMIFSGDIAGSAAQLNKTCTYLDSLKIPYFFILGNHDHQYLGYDTIKQRVDQTEYGYIEKGPDDLESPGNYTIKIKNKQGNLVHGLVLMDSGDRHEIEDESRIEYVTNKISGVHYGEYKSKTTYCAYSTHWDGIRGKQIEWYASKVDELNCETTLVCHIPFLEYCKAFELYQDAVNKHDEEAMKACGPIGGCHMGEAVSGSIENLGMFDKIKEKNSTKNVICGHDHVNDFSLLYQGVRLTYALKTGNGAYWKTDGSICGYTELKINNTGSTSLDQVYFNPTK